MLNLSVSAFRNLLLVKDLMLGLHLRGSAAASHAAEEPLMKHVARCSGWLRHNMQPAVQLHRGRMLSTSCAAAGNTDAAGRPRYPQERAQSYSKHLGGDLLRQNTPSMQPASTAGSVQPANNDRPPQPGATAVNGRTSAGAGNSSSITDTWQNTSSAATSQGETQAENDSVSSSHGADSTNRNVPWEALRPRKVPRPRRSATVSASIPPTDGATAPAPKAAAAARKAGQVTADIPPQPAAAAAGMAADAAELPAAAAAGNIAAIEEYTVQDVKMRSSHVHRKSRDLQLPTKQPSGDAQLWCRNFGIPAEVLQHWGAGMAVVQHPQSQQQVEVLALPYYRAGKAMDVRYLHIEQGKLLGSWLAAQSSQMYINEAEVQDADTVVFVGSELEALLLSAIFQSGAQQETAGAKVAAIAVSQQTPVFLEQQQQWTDVPALQLLRLRSAQLQQRQQRRHMQPAENPQLCLQGLKQELDRLRKQQSLGAGKQSSNSSSSNSSVQQQSRHVGDDQITNLQLLLGSKDDKAKAVIAVDHRSMDSTADPAAAKVDMNTALKFAGPTSTALADCLGQVSCNVPSWPDKDPVQLAAQWVHFYQKELQNAGQQGNLADGDTATVGAADQQQQDAAAAAADEREQLVHALGDYSYYLQQLQDIQKTQQGAPVWTFPLLNDLAGPDAVYEVVIDSWTWPLDGLERFTDYTEQILQFYDDPNPDEIAVSTGWPDLDNFYKVIPGEVTLVTGVPNSGKSEWLDALAVNLMELHGWRFAVCSMEKRPRDHIRQLLEKVARQPMLTAAYAEKVDRMSEEDFQAAFNKLREHFFVITSNEATMPTLEWVLEAAKAAKIRHNINGLIVDPYNELDPTMKGGILLHEHVNQFMADLRRFARDNNVHCWLVAHPRQLQEWTGGAPSLGNISGGANFSNKTDNGIVVHRDWSKLKELQRRVAGGRREKRSKQSKRSSSSSSSSAENGAAADGGGDELTPEEKQQLHRKMYEVQIIVQKVRNKMAGQRGGCWLMYDRVTGRYHEVNQEPERKGQQQQQQRHEQQQGLVTTINPENLEVLDIPVEDAGSADGEQQPAGAYSLDDFARQGVGEEDALAANRERVDMAM